ncbi:MAG TPA: ThaI family type II restriction endonuclease [Bacteroidales bacterium]|nr:ThaI family type II restriction endonuclease [Bacteroidales bacterium]HCI56197.1 type II restriction endonuclease subunit R [Bacteroidales bacterium]HRC89930.1 ThaI family type II restriction endonuclease [Bacteroidales bacterium]
MNQQIIDTLKEAKTVYKIQNKLPKLFYLAELESSRAGKIGMEVGIVREKIIIALLIYKFGEQAVKTDVPITAPEVDVIVNDIPISIKTITGANPIGIKLIWTVDAEKSKEFRKTYLPTCDMILIQVNWSNNGGFYYISKEIQIEILEKLGRNAYIKLPKAGTNPRGVELTKEALYQLINNRNTFSIPIVWKKETIDFKPYQRWIELWEQE